MPARPACRRGKRTGGRERKRSEPGRRASESEREISSANHAHGAVGRFVDDAVRVRLDQRLVEPLQPGGLTMLPCIVVVVVVVNVIVVGDVTQYPAAAEEEEEPAAAAAASSQQPAVAAAAARVNTDNGERLVPWRTDHATRMQALTQSLTHSLQ